MNTNSPTIQLCLAGNRAWFEGRINDARFNDNAAGKALNKTFYEELP